MRILGRRADRTTAVLLDGGMACVVRGDFCSPPMDEREVMKFDWLEVHSVTSLDRQTLAKQLDRAQMRPLAWFDLGGPGSGNFGHEGRPGQEGGSSDEGGGDSEKKADKDESFLDKVKSKFAKAKEVLKEVGEGFKADAERKQREDAEADANIGKSARATIGKFIKDEKDPSEYAAEEAGKYWKTPEGQKIAKAGSLAGLREKDVDIKHPGREAAPGGSEEPKSSAPKQESWDEKMSDMNKETARMQAATLARKQSRLKHSGRPNTARGLE